MTAKRGRYRKAAYEAHSGGFRYRRAVPADLRDLLKKNFWICTFGKVSRVEAAARANELTARHQRQIAALRSLEPNERYEIASSGGVDAWIASAEDNAKLLPFFEGPAALGISDSLLFDPLVSREMQGQQLLEIIERRADYERVKGDLEKARAFRQRIEGNSRERPAGAMFGLVDIWQKVKPPRNYKTKEKARLYVARFIEIVGDIEPREVARSHALKFRDELHERRMSSPSVDAHLQKLNALFNIALGEGLVDINPFQKVRAHREHRKHADARQGFSGDQIKTILSALQHETDDFAWAVKLLIYHGARSGEIAQLKTSDIAVVSGVPVIRIHDRNGRVKNAASVRDVPIHPKCAGIVRYASSVSAAHGKDVWLFQSFEAQKQGRAHKFQNYFGRNFLRPKVRISESCYTLHSLRHTFRTACREASMPESVSRALMGHSLGKGEHGAYGTAPSLKLRKKWIGKVNPLTS